MKVFPDYGKSLLSRELDSTTRQLLRHDDLVDRFEQSWAEGRVNFESCVDDMLGDLGLRHGLHSNVQAVRPKTRVSRKAALWPRFLHSATSPSEGEIPDT